MRLVGYQPPPLPEGLTFVVNHRLKTWPGPFRAVQGGEKSYDIRRDDRGFEVGDVLQLDEFDPSVDRYTGDYELVRVRYITRGPAFGLPEGLVVMAIELLGVSDEHGPYVTLQYLPAAPGRVPS